MSAGRAAGGAPASAARTAKPTCGSIAMLAAVSMRWSSRADIRPVPCGSSGASAWTTSCAITRASAIPRRRAEWRSRLGPGLLAGDPGRGAHARHVDPDEALALEARGRRAQHRHACSRCAARFRKMTRSSPGRASSCGSPRRQDAVTPIARSRRDTSGRTIASVPKAAPAGSSHTRLAAGAALAAGTRAGGARRSLTNGAEASSAMGTSEAETRAGVDETGDGQHDPAQHGVLLTTAATPPRRSPYGCDGCGGLLLHGETAGGRAQLPDLGKGVGDLAMRLANACPRNGLRRDVSEDAERGVARVQRRERTAPRG